MAKDQGIVRPMAKPSSQAARDAMDRAIKKAEQGEHERLAMLHKPKGNC
jgi:hypothetical protein